jgi:hypothetical protein
MYLTPCEDPAKSVSTTLLRATSPALSGPWTVEQTLSLPQAKRTVRMQGVCGPGGVPHRTQEYILYLPQTNGGCRWGIGRATSADGVTWTKFNDPANDGQNLYRNSDPVLSAGPPGSWDYVVISPVLLQDEQGWQMFYGVGRGGSHTSIGYATSEDGIVWDRLSDAPVLRNTWLGFGYHPPSWWMARIIYFAM